MHKCHVFLLTNNFNSQIATNIWMVTVGGSGGALFFKHSKEVPCSLHYNYIHSCCCHIYNYILYQAWYHFSRITNFCLLLATREHFLMHIYSPTTRQCPHVWKPLTYPVAHYSKTWLIQNFAII
jgi:hypothetical protein